MANRVRIACPKCGEAARVIDSCRNIDDNEMYRKNACVACKHTFFSVEYEIEDDAAFKRKWKQCRGNSYKPVTPETSTVARITFNGETHTYAEWAEKTGLSSDIIRGRLKRGWTVEEALSIANTRKPIRDNSLKSWSNFCTRRCTKR